MAIEDLPLCDEPRVPTVDLQPRPSKRPQREAALTARECGRSVAESLGALATLPHTGHQLSSGELAEVTQDVLAALQLAESAAVALVAEAETRGVIERSTAAGTTQWVNRLAAGEPLEALLPHRGLGASGPLVPLSDDQRSEAEHDRLIAPEVDRPAVPGIEPAHASRIAKVASACRQPRNCVLSAALTNGRVGLASAKVVLEAVDKVMPLLSEATRDQVFGHFLELPAGSGAKAIRELTSRVIATLTDETYLEEVDRKLDATESVTWVGLPTGLTRFTADLAPLHAAQLRHALGALSSPTPGNTCCDDQFHRHAGESTGEPDARTPAKRRADALVLLVTRAGELIDADPGTPTSGQARVVVTIDHDTLAGRLRGVGRTEDGVALEPHVIRRLACDADILPMVLGSDGQPLDVGRRQRLVTGSLRAAVIERDRHCTYPGCGRPPSWCQVHHIVPWHQGGSTSLDNSALLCPRHHTIVHRDEPVAAVTPGGVTWEPRPATTASHSDPAA